MDTLQFVDDERRLASLAKHEIEIYVKATGINFRDSMVAMGLIPMTVLGLEGSGIVTRAGSQASTQFKSGDRVAFLRLGAHATKCRTDYRVAVKIPESISYEDAAALPVVYTTAFHALMNISRLRQQWVSGSRSPRVTVTMEFRLNCLPVSLRPNCFARSSLRFDRFQPHPSQSTLLLFQHKSLRQTCLNTGYR